MSTSTTRRERLHPADRRAQILDAAVEVFGRLGFREGSLKDVAEAVGISVPGLLHHFPTKENLLLSVLEHRTAQRSDRTVDLLPRAGTVAFARSFLEDNVRQPELMRMTVTLAAEATDPEHPAHAYFVQRYADIHEAFTRGFRDDVAAGRAAPALVPEDAADQLAALSDGLQVQVLLRPGMDLLAAFDRATAHLRP
ncbi:TetR/AcrR family transcriptional regulator [Kineococcus sp. LSe6-4]|uniref:TetR/AcrR family transcriptional regulator n=1 Tax=Kineococcus halophytocola TaxID=3234027 RepID=A0ABV4H5W3_9ACTN